MLRQAVNACAGPSRSLASVGASGSGGLARSIGRVERRSISTSAPRAAAPRPVATRPRSQMTTPSPRNVVELVDQYPNHPLLAFFRTEEQEVVVKKEKGEPQTVTKTLPTSLPLKMLARENSSRSWLAPELRTKSSLELHQLWYRCLMERNKFVTMRSEMQRADVHRFVGEWSGLHVDQRIRKTMARIKFVLNERRMALLEAQERAMRRQLGDAEAVAAEDEEVARLWNQGKETMLEESDGHDIPPESKPTTA